MLTHRAISVAIQNFIIVVGAYLSGLPYTIKLTGITISVVMIVSTIE